MAMFLLFIRRGLNMPLLCKVLRFTMRLYARVVSKKWLDKVELLTEDSIPKVKWRQDKTFNLEDFVFLDHHAEDVKEMYEKHSRKLPVDRFWLSHFSGEYFYNPLECTPASYEYERDSDNASICTKQEIDSWIYLASKCKMPRRYAIEFDLTTFHKLHETLQIAFCSDTLARRFRFNLVENEKLMFEVVDKVFFLSAFNKQWNKFSKQSSLKISAPSHVRLQVIDNISSIYFEGMHQMTVRLKPSVNLYNNCFILFWNGAKCESIKIKINNFKYYVIDN